MRVVIFGGAGFIGRYLARALVVRGDTVLVADNLSVKPEEPVPREVLFSLVNVCSVSQVRDALSCEPDVICWFAARQGYRHDWSRYAKTNVMSAYVLFEAIKKLRPYKPCRIILASSQAVYAPDFTCDEAAPCQPFSVYGETKLQQERAFEFFGCLQNILVIALRYSIVLGAGQSLQNSESGVLRNWIREVVKGKAPKVYADGKHIRDFVHVKDVTAANLSAIDVSCEGHGLIPLNIGGFQSSILGLANTFNDIAGGPEPIILGRSLRPGGEYSLTSSRERAAELLHWRPVLRLQTMVSDFVDFAKKRLVTASTVVENEG